MEEVQDTWIQTLSWEDRLEEEIATHSSVLAEIISWIEELGGLQPSGVTKSWTQLSMLEVFIEYLL